MKRLIHTLCILPVAVAIAFLGCNGGGGTIETTNGIVGCVVNSDDTPARSAVVKLFPSSYNPVVDGELGDGFIDTTDTNGNYRFYQITSGTYAVLARNREAATSFLTKGISVDEDSVTTIPAGTLNKSGFITANFSAGEVATNGYVYIPGTDIVSTVGADGSVLLADVPTGTVTTVLLVSGGASQRNVLRNEITVAADDTINVEMPLWKYRRQLVLNTTSSGANVAADVYGFAVLIRLDSSNFDFSQARSGGEDLMFTGRNTVELAREIERWDAASRRAEVWVRVDTVFGNNSDQSITMYWGNSLALESAGSAAVFDSASGYLGVWHLGGNGNDATAHKNDAIACTPADAEGMVGIGKRFNGADSIKIASLLGSPQVVTMSAWASLDTVFPDDDGAEVVSIGDGCLLRLDDKEASFGVSGSFHLSGESTFNHIFSGQYVRKTGWHHIAVAFDNKSHTQSLFIDGVVSSSRSIVDSINYTGMGGNTFIGKHGNGKTNFNFRGMIDEVRISRAILTPERAKLEYMNQKSGDALVFFGE